MKIFLVKIYHLICSQMWVKRITSTPHRVFALTIILAFFFFIVYIFYFSEPIYCSAPNAWNLRQRVDIINQSQTSQWQDLSNLLRIAVNRELARRSQIGATSTVVTLADLGVSWHYLGDTRFSPIPGLTSLVTLKPNLFVDRGGTNVTRLIEDIASDPSLH